MDEKRQTQKNRKKFDARVLLVEDNEVNSRSRVWLWIVRLIGLYLRDTPLALQRLKEAFAAGDTRTLYETAHNLKSTSAILGALKLSELFSEIEIKGRMESTEGVEETLALLNDEFALVCSALRSEVEKEVL